MSAFTECLLCAATVFFSIHWLPYLVSPQHESTRHWRSPRMRALLLFGQFKTGTLIDGIIAFITSSHPNLFNAALQDHEDMLIFPQRRARGRASFGPRMRMDFLDAEVWRSVTLEIGL